MLLRERGGTSVTQATSKSTGVICDGPCGQITLNAASLASATSVGFTVTNAYIGVNDVVVINIASGATAASYGVGIDAVSAGSFKVHFRNNSGGALAEAVVLNYTIIKNQF